MDGAPSPTAHACADNSSGHLRSPLLTLPLRRRVSSGQGPIKSAYQTWTSHGSRPSWDLIAVYLAVMGSTSLYSSERQGTDIVDAAGNERFDTGDTSHNEAQARAAAA
eukprot:2496282-Prymnesium_polylepis.1